MLFFSKNFVFYSYMHNVIFFNFFKYDFYDNLCLKIIIIFRHIFYFLQGASTFSCTLTASSIAGKIHHKLTAEVPAMSKVATKHEMESMPIHRLAAKAQIKELQDDEGKKTLALFFNFVAYFRHYIIKGS